MLGFTHAELKQSRFYQEVTAESRQEGRQEGHLEGLQKGRLEESVTLVLRLLNRRLGSSLSLLHQQHIRQLSLEQTEALAEAVFDFQTAADLTAWLAALPGDQTSSN